MKPTRIPNLILLLIVSFSLSSCCYRTIEANKGFVLFFEDSTTIQTVAYVGTTNTVTVNQKAVLLTLNPADTVSTFDIYYNGGSGRLTLFYKGNLRYGELKCDDEAELDIAYEVTRISSTFNRVQLGSFFFLENAYDNQIRITR